MSAPMIQYLLTLLSLTTNIKYAHAINYIKQIKSIELTPSNKRINGTSVITNVHSVTTINNGLEWSATIQTQHQWQYIIFIDHTFGFDELIESALRFTVNINQLSFKTDNELLFGITSTNSEYISFKIPLSGLPNQIYPACSQAETPTQLFGIGDISSLPKFNRVCDIADGSCSKWQNMIPPNMGHSPSSWLTFTLENHPNTNTIAVSFDTDTFPPGFQQTCHFGSIFPNNGLKIYISGTNPLSPYQISSFDIQSQFGHGNFPTKSPTVHPTNAPTKFPTNIPSLSPSKFPTINPTKLPTINPTISPSKFPTITPSKNPTIPTNIPTISPSKFPTITPTMSPSTDPSISPSKNPTIPPSIYPSEFPTINPTNFPTINPSVSPSDVPSTQPSISPSKFPTSFPSGFPTKNPSLSPTNQPTLLTGNPTVYPTYSPVADGYIHGAYHQICDMRNPNKLCSGVGTLTDGNSGNLACSQPYDCCMCKTIQCGLGAIPCNEFMVGLNGIFGVKDVRLAGNPIVSLTGVRIVCLATESCKESVIHAKYVSSVKCYGKDACQNTVITVTNPKPKFLLECTGYAACKGLKIDINIPAAIRGCGVKGIFEFSKIKCSNGDACGGMEITVNNEGCDAVSIQEIDCMGIDACNEAVFDLIGDVNIENCQCGPSCDAATGLGGCFENLAKVLCNTASMCKEVTKKITNPVNGFEFICGDAQSCENGNFVIALGSELVQPVTSIKGIFLKGVNSGRNAIFTIENRQGIYLQVNKLECGGLFSCVDMTFITGFNVVIDKIICNRNACLGCVIKETVNSPGVPCDPSQI